MPTKKPKLFIKKLIANKKLKLLIKSKIDWLQKPKLLIYVV